MSEIITLITGANKGMGFELSLELGQAGQHILVGARNEEAGLEAVDKLRAKNIKADLVLIDVANTVSVATAQQHIKERFGYLNILINNAGIALDNYAKPSKISLDAVRGDFEVNFFGTMSVTQTMLPLLHNADFGKVINISSGVGSLTLASDPTTSVYQHSAVGYQASKTALNMFTVDLANELKDTNVTVNAVNPGWVNTPSPVGGGNLTVQQGVARTVEIATNPTNDLNGTFSDINGILPW
ncbi:SDR family NAD(P)-dependent oxidoreductase [Pediococcus argentinicus]|uniref:Carbonyl reductase n=1 Tax=Pediococcus argentinicus TaxID=480391 RepID=A0A0R2NGC7_9LACO|nr:SDR family NAD(P)-dependent oxidoreductase [Pediococcus argentinicus]KRO24878.1 hypothetical protein IV88_GL000541 [Pediococcus argentinicus]NKZ22574.1 SDR family NAD(P)-dependent oxidoreductase [Pediococcus argentinicus]GEP19765.1 carbonyl reductase [Pediococcus argentinicus]